MDIGSLKLFNESVWIKMNQEIIDFLQFIFKDFFTDVNDPSNLFHKIILSLIIIFAWLGILKISKKLLLSLNTRVKFYRTLYKILKNIIGAIFILLLLGIWINVKNSALLILLIVGILTVFSVKNLSTNIVAWFMLLRKKYFKLYDRIEVDGIKGDVLKITPFYFKIVERGNNLSSSTATGRIIRMPNHILLNSPIYNYNELLHINWEEVKYHITVDSDWKTAVHIVETEACTYLEEFLTQYTDKELREIKRTIALFDEELKVKTYVLLEEESIAVVAQFPIHYASGTSTKSQLHERILPQLNNTAEIELNGKTLHLNVDNYADIQK